MTAATAGGQPTGTSAGGVSDYAPSAPNETRALSLRTDYLRTEVDLLGGEVQELHGEVRERDLRDRTLDKTKKSVVGLLDELASDRGMGWSDIAEVLGVSISAIRKWRKAATPARKDGRSLPGWQPYSTCSRKRASSRTRPPGWRWICRSTLVTSSGRWTCTSMGTRPR
jgi:hypothetical protein